MMFIRMVVVVAASVLLMGCGQDIHDVQEQSDPVSSLPMDVQGLVVSGASDEAFLESLERMSSMLTQADKSRLGMEIVKIAESIIPQSEIDTISEHEVLGLMKKTLDGKNRGDISKMAIMLM